MVSRFVSAMAAVSFFLVGTSVAAAQSKTFKVDSRGGSRAEFVSDAPLETMTGVTGKLSGEVVVDLAKPGAAKAKLKAEVASIRTGSDLRDEHLASDSWLDAKKNPYAIFEVTSVSGVSELQPNKEVSATVKGKFTLHGVTRDVTAKAKVRYVPESQATKEARVKGDILRIQATFSVHLEDYKVSVPTIVRLKVAEQIEVKVDIRATSN